MEQISKTMEKWSETLGKARKMVCPRRCIWGGDRETGIEGSERKRHCLMVTRIRSNFCQ